jgi:hypothetical protein
MAHRLFLGEIKVWLTVVFPLISGDGQQNID